MEDPAKSENADPKRGICRKLCFLWGRCLMAKKRGKDWSFGEGEDSVYVVGSCGNFFPIEPVP